MFETGARIKSVKTAWENARLKAHGYEVKQERNARLSAECRRQLADINLHFHDLRREAGSRLLDAGVPLGVIQAFLDHANISTSPLPEGDPARPARRPQTLRRSPSP